MTVTMTPPTRSNGETPMHYTPHEIADAVWDRHKWFLRWIACAVTVCPGLWAYDVFIRH